MIIVNLKGGLGNQMFQYACGRALSLRNNDPSLKLNTSGLDKANKVGDIYRPYGLSHFNIKAGIATPEEVRDVANPHGLVSKAVRYVKSKYFYNFYIHFVPEALSYRGNIYLDGYFQSEKYFSDFANIIREDFTPTDLSIAAKEFIKTIQSTPSSVSIHIRRGDYVGHKTLGSVCTKEYYANALRKISASLSDPHFFVFSDDIEWVQTNLQLPLHTKYVSAPELAPYEELLIMSACEHNVIANSSFSWWGAWLNPHPKKIVVAPKVWARGRAGRLQSQDIIPDSWVKI